MKENNGSFNLVNDNDNDSELLKSINDNLETIASVATGKLEEDELRKFVHKLDNNNIEEMSQSDLNKLFKKISDGIEEKDEVIYHNKSWDDYNKLYNDPDVRDWLRKYEF